MTTSQATILLIDDNITNLKTAMTYLEEYSFKILTARSGQKGIARAQLTQPDLILLDVQMPDMDGFETCKRLKANPQTQHIPVIFMTVYSETAAKVKGLQVGAVDYITKPFEADELLARVNTHLSLHQLQTELERLVQERTAELEHEIEQRQKQQAEKEQLWQTIHHHNEQFRTLTQLLLDNQPDEIPYTLNQKFQQNLQLLSNLLTQSNTTPLPDNLPEQLDHMQEIVGYMQSQTQAFTDLLEKEQEKRNTILQNHFMQLSEREREVMYLLVDGKSTNEIAQLLTIAQGTVSTYRRRILEKLNVSDIVSLVNLIHELDASV